MATGILKELKGTKTIELPSYKAINYPVDVFPKMITDYVYEAERVSNFEPAYILSSTIAVIGAAIGNKYRGAVKPDYLVPTNFNVLLIGSPGAAKSPAIKAATDPIIGRDILAIEAYQQEKRDYKEREKQAREANETFTEDQPVLIDRYIFKDATIEALYSHLEKSFNGTLIVADEYLSFTKNWNKYNGGDARGQFLSWIDCNPITVDTKRDGVSLVKYPHVSTMGGIQPDRLPDLFGNSSDGLPQRFLIAYSDRRFKALKDEVVNPKTIHAYKNAIQRAIELPFNYDSTGLLEPKAIHFNKAAKQIYFEWQYDIEQRVAAETSQTAISILTKTQSYAARLATVLQVTYYLCNEGTINEVTERAIRGAIELAEYYISTSFRAHGEAHDSNPAKNLIGNKAKLYEALPQQFKASDATELAARLGMDSKEFYRLAKVKGLFDKPNRGEYEKLC